MTARDRIALEIAGDYRWALRMRSPGVRRLPWPEALATGAGRPVVLVPGVYETWHFLRGVAERLHADDHPVHAVPGLGVNARPIPESAAILRERLAELDVQGAVLVAHSKGGLIAELALEDLATAERVRRIVAVATPFRGSRLASWTPLPSLRAFRTSDPVIRGLVAARAADVPITSIFPRVDPHIPDGSRLDGARNVELPLAGHFSPLHDARGIDAVARAVAEA